MELVEQRVHWLRRVVWRALSQVAQQSATSVIATFAGESGIRCHEAQSGPPTNAPGSSQGAQCENIEGKRKRWRRRHGQHHMFSRRACGQGHVGYPFFRELKFALLGCSCSGHWGGNFDMRAVLLRPKAAALAAACGARAE